MKINSGNPLLAELRQMQALASANSKPVNATQAGGSQFGAVISEALQKVNAQQVNSADLQHRVELGDKSVSLVQAMIESQKANISLQATVQVRNRLVNAYQEIMNMPI